MNRLHLTTAKRSAFVSLSLWLQLLSVPVLCQGLEGKISLQLSCNKSTFVMGELIYLDNSVVNLTDKALAIPEPSARTELGLSVQDLEGNFIIGATKGLRIGPPPEVLLPANGKIVSIVDLITYGNGEAWTGVMKDFIPGTYRISVGLAGVRSNVVEIEIIKRSPEEQAVHNRLAALYRFPRKSDQEAIAECTTLIQEFPSSIYVPNIYWQLMFHLAWSDRAANADEIMSRSLEFIDRFPNHGAAIRALTHYRMAYQRKLGVLMRQAPSIQQESVIENELIKIGNRYPNTRIPRFVDDEIKKSREWWGQLE